MKNKDSVSVFEVLSGIDVTSKYAKKGKLDYLSWAWAWAYVKKHYPDVQRTVYETEEGRNYFHDNRTAWVKVGVTIEGTEHIDYLPIMNTQGRYTSKSLETITSFDVNTTIQRSTVKVLALHGLGIGAYVGEDLVDLDNDESPQIKAPVVSKKNDDRPTGDPLKDIMKLQEGLKAGRTWEQMIPWLKKTYEDLTIEEFKSKIDA